MRKLSNFDEIYTQRVNELENHLENILNEKVKYHQTIIEAMKYSLLNGGKRIRAMLVMGFYELCGKNYKEALNTASVIEMIHSYSLIHDDLPCMDNDDYRRGKLTSHKVFGEGMAVLAGDSLLTTAFQIFSENKDNFCADKVVKGINCLATQSGYNGMIGGQVIDIENENQQISEDMLYTLHALKTGALIKCACELGVIMAGGDEKMLEAAEKYGENIGLAFQIQDDILDVIGNAECLGKSIGSDKENGKTTFVTLYGLEKSKKMADECFKKAYNTLNEINGNKEFLIALTDFLNNRTY